MYLTAHSQRERNCAEIAKSDQIQKSGENEFAVTRTNYV